MFSFSFFSLSLPPPPCSLHVPLSFPLSSFSGRFLFRLRSSLIPRRRCPLGARYPIRRPWGPPFRPTVPLPPSSQHLRSQLPGLAAPTASRLSQPAVPGCIERDHYNRPSITTLHITHYKLPVSPSPLRLAPTSLRPSASPLPPLRARCPFRFLFASSPEPLTKRLDPSNFRSTLTRYPH